MVNRIKAMKLSLLAASMLALPALASTYVYVSNADSGTISRYALDSNSGKLSLLGDTPAASKVMPMAVSPDKKHLYSAVRSKPWSVISWDIQRSNGDLVKNAVTPVSASYPYISVDKTGRYLLAASYDSDIVTSNLIDRNGIVTDKVTGSYKTGPHAHSVITDHSNRFLYIGNLGADHVVQLRLTDGGGLAPIGSGYVSDEQESGPRHSVISPDNRYLYNLTEMSGSVTQYRIGGDGALSKINRWPNAVAEKYKLAHGKERSGGYNDPTPRIWSADIKMTPNGHFLYVTERTSSTITGYKISPHSGALTLIGSWPVEKQPRGIAIDESGKWLIVTGEQSDKVGSYAINGKTGKITEVSTAPCGKDANWATIVAL